MTELLLLFLVAGAYALGKAREERDRLLLVLAERRSGVRCERDHWEPIEGQLEAERQVWRSTAAVQRVARQAMREIVASVGPDVRPSRPGAAATESVATQPSSRSWPDTRAESSAMAEGLRRAVKEAP